MIWIGAIIVILTFVAIIKKVETRLALFLAGLLMAPVAGKPWFAIMEFESAMVNKSLVPIICSVMGFAYVLKLTQCDQHLVHALTKPLSAMRPILVPGAILATFLINISLTSAAGSAAAVGAVLIPALVGAGIHPATAAAAVFAGTWGSAFNPGTSHIPIVAGLAKVDPMIVIGNHTTAVLGGLATIMILSTCLAMFRKETSGYIAPDAGTGTTEVFRVNPIKAFVPIIPLILLVATNPKIQKDIAPLFGMKTLGLPVITILQAMLMGSGLAFLVSLSSDTKKSFAYFQDTSKQFFAGMGEAYGAVIGIIICAASFTAGMKAIGLTDSLITFMKNSTAIAKFAATLGPMLIAFLSGSGDAATLAFNQSITPHATDFGFGIMDMGSQAFLTGSWGRSFSPVAGAAIVLAGLAKIDPIELTKRNALPMIAAAFVSMFILLG